MRLRMSRERLQSPRRRCGRPDADRRAARHESACAFNLKPDSPPVVKGVSYQSDSQVTIPGPISICRRPTRSWIATGTSIRAAAKLATLSERRIPRWVAFNSFFPAVEEAQLKGQVVKDDPFGHPEQRNEAWFKCEIAPKLDGFSLKEIGKATGLSLAACSRTRAGARVPHPRHSQALIQMLGGGERR